MRRDKRTEVSDTAPDEPTDPPEVHGEVVHWEGGTPANRVGDHPGPAPRRDPIDVTIPQRGAVQPAEPKVVRVRRSLLLWLVCLLVVAVLVIVALVRYLPGHKPTPTALATTSGKATPSATQPSPTESATSSGPSTGASGGASPGATDGSSPGTSASPVSTTSAVPAGGGGPGAPIADLSALTPVSTNNISSPSTGPEQIGSTTYQDSVRLTCYSGGGTNQSNVIYDVAGYKYLNTVIGIPSNASNAAGNAMTITFYKDGSATQLTTPVTVTLDHPQSVHLNLQDSSQLDIACDAINTASQQSAYMDVAFGNATIGPN
jgi:hypothetical protein